MKMEESPWSPPSIGLKNLLVAVTAFCLACAVIKTLEMPWGSWFRSNDKNAGPIWLADCRLLSHHSAFTAGSPSPTLAT